MSKNYNGRKYYKFQKRMEQLVNKLDRRAKDGKNLENTDPKFNNYRIENGARVWSF
jgi:hypothetical protein